MSRLKFLTVIQLFALSMSLIGFFTRTNNSPDTFFLTGLTIGVSATSIVFLWIMDIYYEIKPVKKQGP